MKLKSLALALALCASAPAMACTSTFSLGTLAPSSVRFFGNDFGAAQSFSDCYTFTLSQAPTSATTTTIEWDWSQRLNIDLTSVTLAGSSLLSQVNDPFFQSWTFGGLSAGSYVLQVAGNVIDTHNGSIGFGVGYGGMLTTSGVVTPVPEPESLAMLALGLTAVVWGARRKS